MKRQTYPDAVFVLVEGKDDKKLYERFFDSARCRIQTVYGRPNVEAALNILGADRMREHHVLGIVDDADFDVLEGRAAKSSGCASRVFPLSGSSTKKPGLSLGTRSCPSCRDTRKPAPLMRTRSQAM